MASSDRYITFPETVDAQDLIQKAFAFLQAKIPGWTPHESQLDVWTIEGIASEAADIGTQASRVPRSIFRYFGSSLFNIPPIGAGVASVDTTWVLSDSAGHTIPAGTQVAIQDNAGNLIPFTVITDVVVPGGSSSTSAGQVICAAVFAGAASSDLGSIGGPVVLLDSLAWVDHITQIAVSAGGSDPETDNEYLNRLSLELQLMSPRPILPRDFAVLARNIAGVQRSLALDGYNPGDNTWGNERMITVVSIDAAGTWVGGTIDTAVSNYLESLRETTFEVHTMAPTSVNIDVTAHVTSLPGWVPSDVRARVIDTIASYLSPAVWGTVADLGSWENESTIVYIDLATAIRNTPGVRLVTLLQIGAHGGALAEADYVMAGIVTLPHLYAGQPTVVAV